ncbi:MAG TPA: hypothetical protein VNZ48_14265, partial [Xanthobacteraceae bacterium]|nr:hypothetical protein [Xanthobacteraceae bacterium]
YVLAEGSPEYYQEFIQLFPHDPLCDRIRWLLGNLLEATAWHRAVLANSPPVYKAFYDSHANGPYALAALKLQSQPKTVPLMQPTHLIVSHEVLPTLKVTGTGTEIIRVPNGITPKQPTVDTPASTTKIVTLPVQTTNPTSSNGGSTGKIAPKQPVRTDVRPVLKLNNNAPQGNRFQGNAFSGKINGGLGGNSGPRFAQSTGSFGRRMH